MNKNVSDVLLFGEQLYIFFYVLHLTLKNIGYKMPLFIAVHFRV